jgi:DNA primase
LDSIGIKENEYTEKKLEEDASILRLPSEFKSLTNNDGSREYKEAKRYAKKRGITPYDVIKYNLGYCAFGRFRNRIIFPSYDKDNNLNFFTGRSYYDEVYLKYDNCDASRDLIGFENMVDFGYPINLVEGPLDAIAVKRNVIPLFGTYLSSKLKTALLSHKPEVNIILDPDAVKHSLEMADFLLSNGIKTKLVLVGKKDEPKTDAGKLGFKKITQLIKETEYLDFIGVMRLRLGL